MKFILQINIKMSAVADILIFTSKINFKLIPIIEENKFRILVFSVTPLYNDKIRCNDNLNGTIP